MDNRRKFLSRLSSYALTSLSAIRLTGIPSTHLNAAMISDRFWQYHPSPYGNEPAILASIGNTMVAGTHHRMVLFGHNLSSVIAADSYDKRFSVALGNCSENELYLDITPLKYTTPGYI